VPNPLRIFINFAHAMERYTVHLAFRIHQFKGGMAEINDWVYVFELHFRMGDKEPDYGPPETPSLECPRLRETWKGQWTTSRAAAKTWLKADVPVDEHLADQLLIPVALAGGGSFRTAKPSLHTTTNANVIQRFLPVSIRIEQESELAWRVTAGNT